MIPDNLLGSLDTQNLIFEQTRTARRNLGGVTYWLWCRNNGYKGNVKNLKDAEPILREHAETAERLLLGVERLCAIPTRVVVDGQKGSVKHR